MKNISQSSSLLYLGVAWLEDRILLSSRLFVGFVWVFLFGYFFAKGNGMRIGLTDYIKHAITEKSCYQVSCYQYIFVNSKISRQLTILKSTDSCIYVSQNTEDREHNKPSTLLLSELKSTKYNFTSNSFESEVTVDNWQYTVAIPSAFFLQMRIMASLTSETTKTQEDFQCVSKHNVYSASILSNSGHLDFDCIANLVKEWRFHRSLFCCENSMRLQK